MSERVDPDTSVDSVSTESTATSDDETSTSSDTDDGGATPPVNSQKIASSPDTSDGEEFGMKVRQFSHNDSFSGGVGGSMSKKRPHSPDGNHQNKKSTDDLLDVRLQFENSGVEEAPPTWELNGRIGLQKVIGLVLDTVKKNLTCEECKEAVDTFWSTHVGMIVDPGSPDSFWAVHDVKAVWDKTEKTSGSLSG